ncbi:MAG: hypothetical protein EZS28_009344 [Streblomastix strix]|uniref:Uncharacterized protein n=1 Tax=Streblomastix strix TaxID=222440 RepID=A0A5J4WJW6_9EUKA|nr:MAG: hypothetical protein EZS28_009344 [Streblomastix strix]
MIKLKSPTIPEIEPQFEKEIEVTSVVVAVASYSDPFQQPVQQRFQTQIIKCETPTLSTKRRSSLFEETLTPDSSVCRWLFDIVSEDEHMIKESAHFVLSENQLIRVVVYTFDVSESQVQQMVEDEGCCALEPYNHEKIDAILDEKLNVSEQIDAYSKIEDEALLLLKADKSELIDAYSKQEDDELLAIKINITDQIEAQTIYEEDDLLQLKGDKTEPIVAYSKTEDDDLLLQKADKIELDCYINLTSTQTIAGQKQFGIINVSSISKQNKNDASILLAGGGDMLVSSLISQRQLQDIRDIASGKSKGNFFATTDEMKTLMKDTQIVAK